MVWIVGTPGLNRTSVGLKLATFHLLSPVALRASIEPAWD